MKITDTGHHLSIDEYYELFKLYEVDNSLSLIEAMSNHIKILQERLTRKKAKNETNAI